MTPPEDLRRSYRYAAILALALVAYWPTFQVGFLWDDHVTIEANPALREWSYPMLKHDFTTDVFNGQGDPYFRPAATLLSRLDYTLWGLHPFGYHLTNWIGHALNALLIQELAIALGFGNLVGLLVGCLFAVHPAAVEQLMIVSGRAEIFGMTFMLMSLLFLSKSKKETTMCVMGYAAYTVALFFKESSIATPLLLLCIYAYKRSKSLEYWKLGPLLAITVLYLSVRYHAVGSPLQNVRISYVAQFFIEAFPKILLIYARLILIPWNLHSHRLVPHLSYLWPILFLFMIVLPLVLCRKRYRLALFGWSWFVIAILPKTPGMIYGNFILDHWVYSASFGMLLPISVGYARLWEGQHTRLRYGLAMSLFPLLIFWALLVHLNVALRGTDEKMYRWALHFTTSNPIKYNLAVLLVQSDRPAEAVPYLLDYLQNYPNDAKARLVLSEAFLRLGHPHAAKRMMH